MAQEASHPTIMPVRTDFDTQEDSEVLPDGGSSPIRKGTRMAIIAGPMAKYRAAAERELLADKNVRDAAYKRQMATASAYANRKDNQTPTMQNKTGNALGALQGAFMGGGQ